LQKIKIFSDKAFNFGGISFLQKMLDEMKDSHKLKEVVDTLHNSIVAELADLKVLR